MWAPYPAGHYKISISLDLHLYLFLDSIDSPSLQVCNVPGTEATSGQHQVSVLQNDTLLLGRDLPTVVGIQTPDQQMNTCQGGFRGNS